VSVSKQPTDASRRPTAIPTLFLTRHPERGRAERRASESKDLLSRLCCNLGRSGRLGYSLPPRAAGLEFDRFASTVSDPLARRYVTPASRNQSVTLGRKKPRPTAKGGRQNGAPRLECSLPGAIRPHATRREARQSKKVLPTARQPR